MQKDNNPVCWVPAFTLFSEPALAQPGGGPECQLRSETETQQLTSKLQIINKEINNFDKDGIMLQFT